MPSTWIYCPTTYLGVLRYGRQMQLAIKQEEADVVPRQSTHGRQYPGRHMTYMMSSWSAEASSLGPPVLN
jgi:hypothetical protein